MAPFITNPAFRFHPNPPHLYAYMFSFRSEIHKLTSILLHKLPPVIFNNLNAREFGTPMSFYPEDIGPGPETNPVSLSSNTNVGGGAPARHRFDPVSFNHLSVWAYLALAFVILVLVTVFSYMIYSCYHTAEVRITMKPKMDVGASEGEGEVKGEVKGGWQTLEDHVGEMTIEGSESRLTKNEEKVGDYQNKDHKDDTTNHWSDRRRPGLKGLGIQIELTSKSEYDFPNESQSSIIPGGHHSTCSDGSLSSTSDHEHEQDLESSECSDCPSMSAAPLAHANERSATYLPFNLPPLPLPLPLPLPSPVTPSPPAQKQQVKHKRTRLRALTQILSRNLTQNQNGREMYFELQPMIKAEKGGVDQSKGLTETLDESSPPSPSPPRSRSKFAFFAPYPNTSNSTSNLNSNATFTCNSNSSCSPSGITPITPLTPITPMTPVTPVKPGPNVALKFDSNNIQFVETPLRNSDARPGADSVGASPPDVQGALAATSMNSLTRAEMLWNDPKLSPVQGAFGVDGEKNGSVIGDNSTEIVLRKTKAAGTAVPSKLESPTSSVWQTQSTFDSASFPGPTLGTPDQVHHGHANLCLGSLRRGLSLSLNSPPSPSPSNSSCLSSDSAGSSPSIATARFMLDRGELQSDNLRNRAAKKEKGRDRKENNFVRPLSPIPRPVFLPHPQTSKLAAEESF